MPKKRKRIKNHISIGKDKSRVLLNPQNLSFPKELEGKFLRDYYKSSLMMLRYSFLLGIFYYASFALLDNFALPEIKYQLYTIRFLIVCPVILTVYLMSYTKRFYKWWQLAAFISVLVSGLGIIVMLLIAPDLGRDTYYTGLILVLIYNYMLVKLRFTWSSIAGIIIVGAYVLAMNILPDCDQKVSGINTFFLFSANLLGMFGGYTLEYYNRRDFYFRFLLNKERKKVKMDNAGLEVAVYEKTRELQEDINKRKEIEQALRESEKKFRFLATNSVDVIWQMDLKLKFTYISPAVYKHFGYKAEEWIGSKLSEHCTTREFFKMARKALGAVKNYQNFNHIIFESKMLRKDGSLIPVEIIGTLILNNYGLPVGLQGSTRDITERAIAQAKIKQNLYEKSSLLRELYHRTKNNMQVIISMMKMQSRYSNNKKLQNSYREIINKIHAMSLVHQRLYEAKDLSQINLKKYIEEFTKHLIKSYDSLSNMIKLKLDLKDIFISIDSAVPLGIVITELFSNAFKHAFSGTIDGKICISLQQEENGDILLDFSDNGIGVPATKDMKNLNTMGLKNVYNLVEHQLRGKISYEVSNGLKWKISFSNKGFKKRV